MAMVQVAVDGASAMAIMWDADILIWATSQAVHTQEYQSTTSRRIQARLL